MPRVAALLLLAATMVVVGVSLAQELTGRALLSAGVTLGVVAACYALKSGISQRRRSRKTALAAAVIEQDASPGLVTDSDGVVRLRNAAARTRFGPEQKRGETLAEMLRSFMADPTRLLFRLARRASAEGAAREDVVTRLGAFRIAVHRLDDVGLLWRIEDLPPRQVAGRGGGALPVPMMSVGRGGTVLYMNDAARDLVGQRIKSLDRLFTEPGAEENGIAVICTKNGRRQVVLSTHDSAGGRREVFFLPFEADGIEGADGIEALPVPMLEAAPDGRILEMNRLAADLLGPGGGTGGNLTEIMQGLGRPVGDWLRDIADGKPVPGSGFLRLSRQDKEAFVQVWLSATGEATARRVVVVLSDATELKTLEAQFVQGQKMQAVGQLAGGIAHDFNNLLTAISGHCDLLLLRHDRGDQDFGDLEQIHQNANRAAALVSQLLAFSRKQTLRPEILDLRDTLADLTHLLNRLVGEKVTLTLSHDPVSRCIRADKRQLEQVLMNLVVNARDAMPGGGEIRLVTEAVTLEQPLRRDRATVPPGEYVSVRVIDEGEGIPPDVIGKIFEPFFSTKRLGEGTGLGLSTVYGIVKQTGGFIFVDSVAGQGTEFTLFFPADDGDEPAAKVQPDPPAKPEVRQGEGTVLLVEDEAPVRAFASRALRLRGYTVIEADSGEEALRALSDTGLEVDVFVTDVVMPGMDGPSWVAEALKTRPDARVVFVSGYAEGAFGEEQARLPNSVFLPKPFSLDQLTETVRGQLP